MFTDGSIFQVLYSNNLEGTKEFYNRFGVDCIEEEEYKLVYKISDYELHYISPEGESNEGYKYNAKGGLGIGSMFYVGSMNIELVHKKLSLFSTYNLTSIVDNHWGSKEFLFEDPNGYKFVVYEDEEF